MKFIKEWWVVVLAVFVISCSDGSMYSEAALRIRNSTGKKIENLKVTVGNYDSSSIAQLKNDSMITMQFSGFGDASYNIAGQIEGRAFADSVGYITHHSSYNDSVNILIDSTAEVKIEYFTNMPY